MNNRPQNLIHPLQIGPIRVSNNIWLAPMAGVSELPFRRICADMGAGLVITELVSARGLRYAKTLAAQERYMAIDGLFQPTAIQLFGAEADDFRAALERIFSLPQTREVAIIDINMGCPVPKVVKSGSGAALLQEPQRACAIVRAVRALCEPLGKACTVKTRIGFAAGENHAAAFCLRLAEAGANAISLHGRTRSQMYGGQADRTAVAEAKTALVNAGLQRVPLIANGDVVDGPSALRLLCETGADGLMIGRKAMGNPWIFPSVIRYLEGSQESAAPSASERAAVGRRHSSALIGQLGAEVACRELRKTLAWYTKGLPHAAELRLQASRVATSTDVESFWEAVEALT